MQDGKQTDVLIPDFSKTFDKVVPQRLICKLDYYGVTGKANRWIESFLSSRTQTIILDGTRSYEGEVVSESHKDQSWDPASSSITSTTSQMA